MSSLQYLTLATVISISSLGTIQIAEAKTSIIHGRNVSLDADNNKINNSILAKGDRYYLAQNSSDNKQSSETEDEIIKQLQKRDKKIAKKTEGYTELAYGVELVIFDH